MSAVWTGWAMGLALAAAGLVVWPARRAVPARSITTRAPVAGGAAGRSSHVAVVGRGDAPGTAPTAGAVGDPQLLGLDVVRVMVLVAGCLRSGSTTGAALEQVAGVERPVVAADLRQVAVALAWGMPDHQAWTGVSPTWAPLSDALQLARQAGIPAYGTLTSAADQLRRELAAMQEERAARAQVLLVLPLTLAYLPAFVLTTIVPVLIGVAVTLTT